MASPETASAISATAAASISVVPATAGPPPPLIVGGGCATSIMSAAASLLPNAGIPATADHWSQTVERRPPPPQSAARAIHPPFDGAKTWDVAAAIAVPLPAAPHRRHG